MVLLTTVRKAVQYWKLLSATNKSVIDARHHVSFGKDNKDILLHYTSASRNFVNGSKWNADLFRKARTGPKWITQDKLLYILFEKYCTFVWLLVF